MDKIGNILQSAIKVLESHGDLDHAALATITKAARDNARLVVGLSALVQSFKDRIRAVLIENGKTPGDFNANGTRKRKWVLVSESEDEEDEDEEEEGDDDGEASEVITPESEEGN